MDRKAELLSKLYDKTYKATRDDSIKSLPSDRNHPLNLQRIKALRAKASPQEVNQTMADAIGDARQYKKFNPSS